MLWLAYQPLILQELQQVPVHLVGRSFIAIVKFLYCNDAKLIPWITLFHVLPRKIHWYIRTPNYRNRTRRIEELRCKVRVGTSWLSKSGTGPQVKTAGQPLKFLHSGVTKRTWKSSKFLLLRSFRFRIVPAHFQGFQAILEEKHSLCTFRIKSLNLSLSY